ncbi:MAG: DUF448 domain-containing protein [Myxococcota bacterium]
MTRAAKRTTQRMCAGCGARTDAGALVRLVVGPSPPFVAVDLGRRLGGRGISVHPTRRCVDRALKKGSLAKALGGPSSVTLESVVSAMIDQFGQRIEGLLSAALRKRRVAVGTDAVRAALSRREGDLLLVAGDARGRAVELRKGATAIGCATAAWGTKASVGQMFSRQELGVVLVTDRGIARAILECLTHIEALSEGE